MAILTTIALKATLMRMLETGVHIIPNMRYQVPATTSGDSHVLGYMPSDGRLYGAHLTVPNSLGAGVTVKLQKRDVDTGTAVDITAASTAATAGITSGSGLVPIDFKRGDTIEALFSGGAVTAQTSQNLIADITVQHA